MIVAAHQHRKLRFPHKETFRAVRHVVAGEKRKNASVSIVFTDDRFIKNMNKRYLRHDRVTDVIAFPLPDGPGVDGEVFVNLDQARRQARDYGVTFQTEVKRLVIHGTLHLLGYRDSTSSQKARMRRREDHYLARL
ncbi:MAG TPA: rRNA maturation RNase YbeY [Bacteroidota bacterium]|nr:rRNA maturation RNase YbeY [Bacteroidota bacterium]